MSDRRAAPTEPVAPGELATLWRSRGGKVLLSGFCLMLAVAVATALWQAPLVFDGIWLGGFQVTGRQALVIGVSGGTLVALCAAIAGWVVLPESCGRHRRTRLWVLDVLIRGIDILWAGRRAVYGLVGLVLGLWLMLDGVLPAINAGAPPGVTTWAASVVMAVITTRLIYPGKALAIIATISVGVSLLLGMTLVTVLMTWMGAPDESVAIAVAGAGMFGALCDVVVTQVTTAIVIGRVLARDRGAEVRHGVLRVGADHLTSMIHTTIYARLPSALMVPSGMRMIGVDVVDAIAGGITMASATIVVAFLSAWVIKGLDCASLEDYGHGHGHGHGH